MHRHRPSALTTTHQLTSPPTHEPIDSLFHCSHLNTALVHSFHQALLEECIFELSLEVLMDEGVNDDGTMRSVASASTMGSLLPSDEFEGYTHQHRFGDGIFISTGTSRPPSRTLSASNTQLQPVDEAPWSGEVGAQVHETDPVQQETDGVQQDTHGVQVPDEVREVEDGDTRREEAYLAHLSATGQSSTNEGAVDNTRAGEVEEERTSEEGEIGTEGKQGEEGEEGDTKSEAPLGPWRGGHLIVRIALYERIMRAIVAVC